jgi:hypothetical protein
VKELLRQYADPKFPDTVGKFFRPIHHNYLYGVTKEEVVARFLKHCIDMGRDILSLYKSFLVKGWINPSIQAEFEKAMTAKARFGPDVMEGLTRDLLNNGECVVLFAEYNMRDQGQMMDLGNKAHLYSWVVIALVFVAAFGFNMSALKNAGWLILTGASVTEFWSYIQGLSGTSIIGFEFMGAVFFKLLYLKKWQWQHWLAMVTTVIQWFSPLYTDPPLREALFLRGKSVLHLAHYVGTIIGWVMVRFILP